MTSILVKDPFNLIICGIGGQGNVLASELLGATLVEQGYYTSIGETYGTSQRGGSVMSHVRVSQQKPYGPLIPLHEADVIVGLEPIETLRVARNYAHRQTHIIFEPRPSYPLGVLNGTAIYPEFSAIEAELRELCAQVEIVEATKLALEAGNPQAANILFMGALTALPYLPLRAGDYEEVLRTRFQGSILELNRRVFNLGYELLAHRAS